MNCGAAAKYKQQITSGRIENKCEVPVFWSHGEKKTVECQLDFEVPDTGSAIVMVPSKDLSPPPTRIEIGVHNIGPVHFLATDQQFFHAWKADTLVPLDDTKMVS